jgi:hypothetical protein
VEKELRVRKDINQLLITAREFDALRN